MHPITDGGRKYLSCSSTHTMTVQTCSNKERRLKIFNSDTNRLICIALYTIFPTFSLFEFINIIIYRETVSHPVQKVPTLAQPFCFVMSENLIADIVYTISLLTVTCANTLTSQIFLKESHSKMLSSFTTTNSSMTIPCSLHDTIVVISLIFPVQRYTTCGATNTMPLTLLI